MIARDLKNVIQLASTMVPEEIAVVLLQKCVIVKIAYLLENPWNSGWWRYSLQAHSAYEVRIKWIMTWEYGE